MKNTVSSNSSRREMNKLRILIVEDNAPFRQILRESLQTSFPTIAIDEVADGAEALQKVDAFLPDLILMDIQLPGENGLELTRKIKAIYPNMTIFILTQHDAPEYRKAAFQCGGDCFLVKTSFSRIRLGELVKSYCKI
jgi:DNA-binding NarL/FixJ family response regulator